MHRLNTFEIRFQEAKTFEEKINLIKDLLEDPAISNHERAMFILHLVERPGFYKAIKTFKPLIE